MVRSLDRSLYTTGGGENSTASCLAVHSPASVRFAEGAGALRGQGRVATDDHMLLSIVGRLQPSTRPHSDSASLNPAPRLDEHARVARCRWSVARAAGSIYMGTHIALAVPGEYIHGYPHRVSCARGVYTWVPTSRWLCQGRRRALMDRARRGYSLASTTAPSDMQRAACQLSQLTSTQRALLARATRHTAPPHTTACGRNVRRGL